MAALLKGVGSTDILRLRLRAKRRADRVSACNLLLVRVRHALADVGVGRALRHDFTTFSRRLDELALLRLAIGDIRVLVDGPLAVTLGIRVRPVWKDGQLNQGTVRWEVHWIDDVRKPVAEIDRLESGHRGHDLEKGGLLRRIIESGVGRRLVGIDRHGRLPLRGQRRVDRGGVHLLADRQPFPGNVDWERQKCIAHAILLSVTRGQCLHR